MLSTQAEKLIAEFCIKLILIPILEKYSKISLKLSSAIKEKSLGEIEIKDSVARNIKGKA